MKKLVASMAVSAVLLAGCSAPEVSEEELAYRDHVELVKKISPRVSDIGSFLTELLHQQCDKPLSKELFNQIANEEPIYVMALAANAMMTSDKMKIEFRDSIVQTVDCDDMAGWPERVKIAWQETAQTK